MNPAAPAPASTLDMLLDGRLRLRQAAAGHRAGTDAILLAAMLVEPGPRIVDAGAGVGAVGLAVALRSAGARVTLVERDAAAAALARENAALNELAEQVAVNACDLLDPTSRRAAGLANEQASALFTNPPFFDAGAVRASPDPARAAAHVLGEGGMGAWLRACLALLAPDGRLALICRPDSLRDALEACENRAGGVRITPVHPREQAQASRILVSARKGSRAPLAILPGLVLHEADGAFTARAQALHRGAALLEDA
jgi:tRNA1(Val) A37 N6-methylase TrmN6